MKFVTLWPVASVAGVALGAWYYFQYRKNKIPTEWIKIGELDEICIYPIKSFKAIKIKSSECLTRGVSTAGFLRDRFGIFLSR